MNKNHRTAKRLCKVVLGKHWSYRTINCKQEGEYYRNKYYRIPHYKRDDLPF